MPWKETRTMDQRTEFALKSMKTNNFRELCREYGISTKTGYKWKQRFLERGLGGLQEESSKPHAHPAELPAWVAGATSGRTSRCSSSPPSISATRTSPVRLGKPLDPSSPFGYLDSRWQQRPRITGRLRNK